MLVNRKIEEFGSDFHYIIDSLCETDINVFPAKSKEATYYISGRQAIQELLCSMEWDRIWVPYYYCYDVVSAIKSVGIEIDFYPDFPTANDNEIISNINFRDKDVLLRVNYFGFRGKRCNTGISVPVIEDHSHDLVGEWPQNSDADWCFASLRKTFPIPDGGMLWSPQQRPLPQQPQQTLQGGLLAAQRLNAMLLKTLYLKGYNIDKDMFRKIFMSTEKQFSELHISDISEISHNVVNFMRKENWHCKKKENWKLLSQIEIKNDVVIIKPEDSQCNSFSLMLFFETYEKREEVKKMLIERYIYPAVLWPLPDSCPEKIINWSNRMLSVHCDGRYNKNDITELKSRIEDILEV
ncbi:MAG: hypothetical protein LBL90_09220 [Prevotellaceae bacterium]|jgi:hypothetical protein|nr:hypothetical protein [Prevotellaceae bacterium]